MAMVVPAALLAYKLFQDSQANGQAQRDATATEAAGLQKMRAMRQGASDLSSYRQSLTPQMLAAMQQQIAQYGGAQNVLGQMYGGHPSAQSGGPPPNMAGPPGGLMGAVPPTLLSRMGPTQPAQGESPGYGMGFGGPPAQLGLPMPSALHNRTVG